MSELRFLKDFTGELWTDVRLSGRPFTKYTDRTMRLGEAVAASFVKNIFLKS